MASGKGADDWIAAIICMVWVKYKVGKHHQLALNIARTARTLGDERSYPERANPECSSMRMFGNTLN